jgi:hypothetical protein
VHRSALAPLLLTAALALTACSGGSSDDAASSDSGSGAGTASDSVGGGAAQAPAPAEGGATTTDSLARVDVTGSALVRTAELGVRVERVREAADRAGRVVRDAGGQVAAERADGAAVDGGFANAELTLRVPPERFDDVLRQLSALGEERSRSTSTEEVGDELVDLESRLATQRASVDRVRALLAEAGDLGQVVQVEAELTRRTADLESLQARLAALDERVALSTVVLRLDSEDSPEAAGAPGFLDGLRGGWDALLASARVAGAVVGALLPFLPVLAVAALVAHRLRRRPAATPVP